MRNRVIVNFYEEDIIYEERLDILASGTCKSIFPLSVIQNENNITAYYCINGYRKLSDVCDIPALLALSIVEKVMLAIEDCYQFLFFPEEYVINMNTVYISKNYECVKFTYVKDKRKECVESKLVNLLNGLKKVSDDKGAKYLNKLMEICMTKKMSSVNIRMIVNELSQEIRSDCGFRGELY